MKKRQGNTTFTIITIILVILIIAVIYFMFFRDNNTIDDNMNTNLSDNNTTTNETDPTTDNTNNNTTNNVTDTLDNTSSAITNDIEIADTNAKELYERVKNGITLNGQVIEIPATYLTRITDKIKVEGYKLSDTSRKAIEGKLTEMENIFTNDGIYTIDELSADSKAKFNTLFDDIENLL